MPETGLSEAEMEVTPQMIEAGLHHLLRFHPNRCDDEDTVIALCRAMVLVRHSPPSSLLVD